jgi:hypothetical protein
LEDPRKAAASTVVDAAHIAEAEQPTCASTATPYRIAFWWRAAGAASGLPSEVAGTTEAAAAA